jgi:glycine hydroxymethyltransferase
MVASGLRLGTPAATTRGFDEAEMRQVAGWIADILDAGGSAAAIERVRPQVMELCRRFPVYGD